MFSDDYDDDSRTCEHCGTRYSVDVGIGHICEQGHAASQKANETWNRNYMGTGERVTIQIAIEVECLNTQMAIESALSSALSEIEWRTAERIPHVNELAIADQDEVLQFRWKAGVRRKA